MMALLCGSDRFADTSNDGATADTFATFDPQRLHPGADTPPPLQEWLLGLPAHDPQRRFCAAQLQGLLESVQATLRTRLAQGPWTVQGVLELVEDSFRRRGLPMPPKVRQDVLALPPPPDLPEQHWLALLLYSAELYDADRRPARHQIYAEFNRVCRAYGACAAPGPDLEADWALFRPFAHHLDAVIQRLPAVPMVLFRGGPRALDTATYASGAQGAWGGCLSASSDRLQAASFAGPEGLQAPSGCYFMILSDAARLVYPYSAFTEEMEHLHPLHARLEVCPVFPKFMVSLANVGLTIATLKRAGRALSLRFHVAALAAINVVFAGFVAGYVPPRVAARPDAAGGGRPFEGPFREFLDGPEDVLLVAGDVGLGKSALGVWLAAHTYYREWVVLYLCYSHCYDLGLFTERALVRCLQHQFGWRTHFEGAGSQCPPKCGRTSSRPRTFRSTTGWRCCSTARSFTTPTAGPHGTRSTRSSTACAGRTARAGRWSAACSTSSGSRRRRCGS